VVHLRIVAPHAECRRVLELLEAEDSAYNIVYLPGSARKPEGDLILCDVARSEVSLLVADLRELDVDVDGSIAIEQIDAEISGGISESVKRGRNDVGSDPVVWENVSSRTSESVELSHSFLIFMTLAMQIAAVGIYFNQPILIVGAMVVGPDFGPIAGICVALVNRTPGLARRSANALFWGFAVGIVWTVISTLLFKTIGELPDSINFDSHGLTRFIAQPDFFSFWVAVAAGIIGMLSLTTAKSSVLIGVLISVTTIPAAANIGVAAAYGDWSTMGGAAAQLGVNLACIFVSGFLTLFVQRQMYMTRRRNHLRDSARRHAGLPLGESLRARVDPDEEPEAT
jgi:uncharacterized hydrophobic protein (TIGR00271 family)